MKKAKRVAHRKNADSDTRSRTRKGSNGTTSPSKRREKKVFKKKALNRALDKALDKDAAWDLFRKIRRHETSFRKQIYEFDVGKGWKVMGHKSLRACFRKRLLSYYSESYLYRQLYAAQIEHNLGDLLPMGKIVPERILRPLNALKDPEQQRKAWKIACKQSDNPIPTLQAVEEAVAKLSGKSSSKAEAEQTGKAKLSEKEQIEALGKQIVAKHDRRFVKELIKWLGKNLPPRGKS